MWQRASQGGGGSLTITDTPLTLNQEYSVSIQNGAFYTSRTGNQSSYFRGYIENGVLTVVYFGSGFGTYSYTNGVLKVKQTASNYGANTIVVVKVD